MAPLGRPHPRPTSERSRSPMRPAGGAAEAGGASSSSGAASSGPTAAAAAGPPWATTLPFPAEVPLKLLLFYIYCF